MDEATGREGVWGDGHKTTPDALYRGFLINNLSGSLLK